MSFIVAVHNPALPHWPDSFTAYLPTLHHFPSPHPDPSIRLLDLVESWKGLSPSQARELRIWHNALRAAIERYIHDALLTTFHHTGVPAHAEEIHKTVSTFGYQVVTLDVDRLLDYAIERVERDKTAQEVVGQKNAKDWFSFDRKVALVNLMRLCHAFTRDSPELDVYMYSELTTGGTGVQVYAEVISKPPIFLHAPKAEGGFTFKSPMLDGSKGAYYTFGENMVRDGDVWTLRVTTLFKDARFERVYRFKYNLPTLTQKPQAGSILDYAIENVDKEPGARKSRRRRRAQLREISQNSVRVQGMSDFERAAREAHPLVFEAHHDHSIGKHDVLGKLYGNGRKPSPERVEARMTTMQEEYNEIRPYLGGVSFRPPMSPMRGGGMNLNLGRRRVRDDLCDIPASAKSTSRYSAGLSSGDDTSPLFSAPTKRKLNSTDSHSLPPLPSSSSEGSESDDEDSIYNFSPVRVRASVLSSPRAERRSLVGSRSRRRHDVRKLFASSPSRKSHVAKSSPAPKSHITASPVLMRSRSKGRWPDHALASGHNSSPAYMGTALPSSSPYDARTAIWRGAPSSSNSDREVEKGLSRPHSNPFADQNDVDGDNAWKSRPRIGRQSLRQQKIESSYEYVPMHHSKESSLDTVEIFPTPCGSRRGGSDSSGGNQVPEDEPARICALEQ